MRKISKMGATALALALSISMAAPISAQAEVLKNYDSATDTYTYVNEDTNEVITFKDGEGNVHSTSLLNKVSNVFYITTKQYEDIPTLTTTPDVVKFTDFKSKSKNLKLRVYRKSESTNYEHSNYAYTKKENGETKYFYRDINGNWQSKTWKEFKELTKGAGSYDLCFFAKKAGKYKVTFNARNAEGAVVATKTITIIARADARPIKSITFGGKNVLTDTDGDGRADYKNYYAQLGGYTTKKKGKLAVKANSGFKIKKIEISPSIITSKEYKSDEWAGTHFDDETEKDLNGNGTTKDIVNNMSETSVSRIWKTVKNNKVIKLYKEDYDKYYDMNLVSKSDPTKTRVTTTNGIFSPTYIRITYYDTKNHKTARTTYTLWLRKRK